MVLQDMVLPEKRLPKLVIMPKDDCVRNAHDESECSLALLHCDLLVLLRDRISGQPLLMPDLT
jgi:hypothetical protein